MLYPLLVMIITIQLKLVRSVFCEYLNFKFSLVEKYSYCFSLSKRILILLFLRLFLAFFLLFCFSQTLSWPLNQGFLQWIHVRTCGTTKEMGRALATFGPNLDTGIKGALSETDGLVEFSPFVEVDGTGEPTSACVDVFAGVKRMKVIIGILNGYFYTCNLTCIGESTLS